MVALDADGVIVGTVTYYDVPSEPEAALVAWFRRPDVGTFGQFAVEPGIQKSGLGARLIAQADSLARADGKLELACETAARNESLVAYYERRGFRDVGRFRWPVDADDCVVLSRRT